VQNPLVEEWIMKNSHDNCTGPCAYFFGVAVSHALQRPPNPNSERRSMARQNSGIAR
jgi:hypothetical protein